MSSELCALGAVVTAAVAGFFLIQAWERTRKTTRHRVFFEEEDEEPSAHARHARAKTSHEASRLTEGIECRGGIERAIVELLALTTIRCRTQTAPRRASAQSVQSIESAQRLLEQAGLGGIVSVEGYQATRLRLGLACAGIGLVVGFVFSRELALLGALAGLAIGWMIPRSIVRGRSARRADELERHLPETLDVIALGLRGGLSFDRSLRLYTEHFDSDLSRGLGNAERQWTHGLVARSDALHALAATYDSQLFSRVIANIVRSLRFGSSMAQSLETTAVEARETYQAKKQEQVAKAPVKIMIPTGTLILPAMLILVLGPVLLELIESF